MNITLEIIQILDAIEQNGSFEAAAQKLHKVRSALTYNIRTFEERLGIQIYDRSKHRAELTPAGRMLLEQGRQLLRLSENIEETVMQVGTGWETVVRVAYDEIINIQPIFDLIRQFQKECPRVNLELYSEVLGGCSEALITQRADIAIGMPGPLPSQSDLIFEPIGKTKFVFVVAPTHPLAKVKEPITTDIIKKYYASVARDSAHLAPSRTSMVLPEQSRITFSNLAMKKEAQIEGLGVGFLPYIHIKNEIDEGKLIIKQVEKKQPETICYLGWNKTKQGRAHTWLLSRLRDKKFHKRLYTYK